MRKLLFVAGILLCSLSIMAQNISLTTMKKTWGTTAPTGAAFDTIKTTTPIYLYIGGGTVSVLLTAKYSAALLKQ